MWEQRAIEIHDEQSNWERRLRCHRALPAPTNFSHAVATRKITTNRHAPTDAEAIGESRNVVTLTVTEFQECSTTRAQQSWQLSDESANQLQPITAAIERKAWLCGNAETRQVARREIPNTCSIPGAINLPGWHIRQVCNEKIKVCWITGCTRRKKRLGEIAVHERDARRHTAAQRIRARHHQRLARDVCCDETQRYWRFVGEGDRKCAAPRADLCSVQRMWRATKCAIGRHAVGKKGECRLNDQLALWPWVKHIWRYEQF